MTRGTRVDGFLLIAAVMAVTAVSNAATVVTQVQSRAQSSVWLLNLNGQQSIAHQQVFDDHDVSPIPVFDARNLSGVDVVYLSPVSGQLNMTAPEIDALETFVLAGGRLVVAADHSGMWSDDFDELAANFDVSYGQGVIKNPFAVGTVIDFANPITNGAGGIVNAFRSPLPNDGLQSTNPDFQVLAIYPGGQAALGFLEVGAGQIVFLTDFNTFDDTFLVALDNQQFWTNLFEIAALCPWDCDSGESIDGTVGIVDFLTLLGQWGGPGSCDFDGGGVGITDFLELLANWGPCP